jgi:hypothetical protein
MLSSILVDEDFAGASRRHVLKSALLSAVCAGLPAANVRQHKATVPGQHHDSGITPRGQHDRSGPLSKRMVSFMLAHEQFPVPELIRLGARRKAPDSISWLPAIISNPGKRTSGTPDRPG